MKGGAFIKEKRLYYIIDSKTSEIVMEFKEYPEHFSKQLKSPVGYYITINSDFFSDNTSSLSPREIADFIYLACNCNFSYCVSRTGSSIPLPTDKVASAIGDTRKKRLTSLAKAGLISFGEGERCYVNRKYVFLGGNKENDKREFKDGIRIYKSYYSQFYRNSSPTDLRTLGTIYRLVPYLNRRWNVITEPENTLLYNIADIKPCRRERLVELMGYKTGNVSTYIKKLTDLALAADGKSYRAVLHGVREKSFPGGFFVNPYLMYYGYSNIEQLLNITVKTPSGEKIGYLRSE